MPKQHSGESKAMTAAKNTLKVLLTFFKWVFIVGIICSFLGAGVAAGYFVSLVKDDPVRHKDFIMNKIQENSTTGFVYFDDNTVVGQLRTSEDRRLASINEIPQVVKDAFIATEDKDFYSHYGIDLTGFFRAVKQKLLREDVQTGGSTITQQVARNVFLTLDQTDTRKAKEILLALRLERTLSKDEILQAYLNKIPFGNGSTGYNLYGIKAAAKGIFDIDDLNQITIAEAAYLAGLPKAPSEYSAFTSKGDLNQRGFQLAVARQHVVLKRMLEERKITQEQYQEALNVDMKAAFAKKKEKAYTTYPYLMIEAEQQAAKILLRQQDPKLTEADLRKAENSDMIETASEHLRRNGYKIYTTINKTIYDTMQEISHNAKNFTPDDPKKGIEQVGAVMIDNKTGAILGMIEGRDFYKEQMNHATQMTRQPGSTMKPVAAYGPAIEMGAMQPAGIIDDAPMIQKDGSKGFHIAENWDGVYHGLMTARRALNLSYNIPALKLFNDVVGIDKAWDYARKMGITTLVAADNQARTGVIGGLTYGVTVKELTGAYTTFANQGVYKDAYMIRKIEDGDGNIIYEHKSKPEQVFSPETAYLITDMLRTVITSGTATDLMSKFKYYGKIPISGKTGSTQNDYDAWFEGYTPDVTLGVWVGYDQPSTLVKGKGTLRAKNIWALVMNAVIDKQPDLFKTRQFEKPDGIVQMTVSDVSGKLPNDLVKQTNHLVTDLFNKKDIPTQEDDVLAQMKVITYNHFNYIPQPTTPADFVQDKIVIRRQVPIKQIIDEIKQAFEKYPSSIPTKRGGIKKKPEDYFPIDMENDAPTEADPRIEDGKIPPPPTEVTLENMKDLVKISFRPDAEEDVIGYRLYRSVNFAPFRKVDGSIVSTGDDSKFINYISPNVSYAYYVTAVDVGGNESIPSQIVYSDHNPTGSVLWPQIYPNGGQDRGQNNGGSSDAAAPPSAPSNVGIASRPGGIGIVITWNANPGIENVTKYNVAYSSRKNGPYTSIGTTDVNRFEYISLPADGWYRVTAVNGKGESVPSQPVEYKSH
ncbi:transglycosylase domain-containing protein [Ferviditalea candida]|uniref:Transglycosylase domain-containing protein n=1 Tax=Ferviditalea candida TaxID=3108399 RepID=A0ABU5ZMY9_9BACL|nr:transglycosylase domain-containing protein [Paenibacillaceae bacterium T2]